MESPEYEGLISRIDTVIVILVELLSRAEGRNGADCLDEFKDKCASLLVRGGVSQEKAGKSLSMQKKRVNHAAKVIRI